MTNKTFSFHTSLDFRTANKGLQTTNKNGDSDDDGSNYS